MERHDVNHSLEPAAIGRRVGAPALAGALHASRLAMRPGGRPEETLPEPGHDVLGLGHRAADTNQSPLAAHIRDAGEETHILGRE